MPRVHRVGDYDTGADRAVTGSPNVFANGGPTLGGDIAAVLDLEDTVGISDDVARRVLESRAALIQQGLNPDEFDHLEYGDGGTGGVSPSGGFGPQAAPGSSAASGGAGATNAPPVGGQSETQGADAGAGASRIAGGCSGQFVNFLGHVDSNITSETCQKLNELGRLAGVRLDITSAYRSPEYNRRVGGARNSQHVQGKACDILWPTADRAGRIRFLELAIQAGFNGIGTYDNFIHVDTRGYKATWGGGGGGPFSQYVPALRAGGWSV
jgi:hypothetical protein